MKVLDFGTCSLCVSRDARGAPPPSLLMCYIDQLSHVETPLHSRNKSYLLVMCNPFTVQLKSVC